MGAGRLSDLSPAQGSAWKASHPSDSPPPGRVRNAEGGIRAGVAGESGAAWTRAGPRPGRYSCPCLRIVDHHGKLIREQPVGSANHETSDVPQEVLPDPSLEFIVEFDRAAPGAHPYRARRTAGGGRCGRCRGRRARPWVSSSAFANPQFPCACRRRGIPIRKPGAVRWPLRRFRCAGSDRRSGHPIRSRARQGPREPLNKGATPPRNSPVSEGTLNLQASKLDLISDSLVQCV